MSALFSNHRTSKARLLIFPDIVQQILLDFFDAEIFCSLLKDNELLREWLWILHHEKYWTPMKIEKHKYVSQHLLTSANAIPQIATVRGVDVLRKNLQICECGLRRGASYFQHIVCGMCQEKNPQFAAVSHTEAVGKYGIPPEMLRSVKTVSYLWGGHTCKKYLKTDLISLQQSSLVSAKLKRREDLAKTRKGRVQRRKLGYKKLLYAFGLTEEDVNAGLHRVSKFNGNSFYNFFRGQSASYALTYVISAACTVKFLREYTQFNEIVCRYAEREDAVSQDSIEKIQHEVGDYLLKKIRFPLRFPWRKELLFANIYYGEMEIIENALRKFFPSEYKNQTDVAVSALWKLTREPLLKYFEKQGFDDVFTRAKFKRLLEVEFGQVLSVCKENKKTRHLVLRWYTEDTQHLAADCNISYPCAIEWR